MRPLHARQPLRTAKPAAAVLAATTFSACTGRSESRTTDTAEIVDSYQGSDTIGLLGLLGASSVMLWAGVKLVGYSIRLKDPPVAKQPAEKLSKTYSPTTANLPPGLFFESPVEMITETESGITAVNRYEEQGPAATVEIVDEDEETVPNEGVWVEEPEMENVFVLRPPVRETKGSLHRRLMSFMVPPGSDFEIMAEVFAMENLSYEETARKVDVLTDLQPDIAEKVELVIRAPLKTQLLSMRVAKNYVSTILGRDMTG